MWSTKRGRRRTSRRPRSTSSTGEPQAGDTSKPTTAGREPDRRSKAEVLHAAGVTFGFVFAVLVFMVVITAIARSQGGGLNEIQGTARAHIDACGRDVQALGLRFQCRGSVNGVDHEPIWSPRDRTGQTVEVLIVTSSEVTLIGKGMHDVTNIITSDHPHGSKGWEFVGVVGPISGLFVVLGTWYVVERLVTSRRASRARRLRRRTVGERPNQRQ